jgi:CheY-like chemotaxis protein
MLKTIKPVDVLIGESNDGHAELVEASLREGGIVNNLYRGRDGAETLALVRATWRGCHDVTSGPSLVLLDCGLPRASGVDVLRTLKSDQRHSWIPVIMMSVADDRQQAELCRHLGCEAYVTKWTVFLGLPGFVRRVRFLANRAIWIASRRLSTGRSHRCCTGTLDLRSPSDIARIYRQKHQRVGKEVEDGSTTP